jgi:hypothetical protein
VGDDDPERINGLPRISNQSVPGRELFHDLSKIPALDPQFIQFGCAEWFWKRQVNSYALQVEPKRHMFQDRISVGYKEALHIEKIRDEFFGELKKIINKRAEQETSRPIW